MVVRSRQVPQASTQRFRNCERVTVLPGQAAHQRKTFRSGAAYAFVFEVSLAPGPFECCRLQGILVVGRDSGIPVLHRSITGQQNWIIQPLFLLGSACRPESYPL